MRKFESYSLRMYNNLRKKFRQKGRLYRAVNKHIAKVDNFIVIDKGWTCKYFALILRELQYRNTNKNNFSEDGDCFSWDIITDL